MTPFLAPYACLVMFMEGSVCVYPGGPMGISLTSSATAELRS